VEHGSVWLEEWKSGKKENGGTMKKWKDRKDFIFSPIYLVKNEKVKKWKK